MALFLTQMTVINQTTGDIEDFAGEVIQAPNFRLAEEWCKLNKPYLWVLGEFIHDMDVIEEGNCPDMSRVIDNRRALLN